MAHTFGEKLRELRRLKEISQRELARQVGVDFSYISKLENDRIPPPAADTIVRICRVLDVPPDELLALTGKMPSEIKNMLSSHPAAMAFIRTASMMELSEAEWERLNRELKRLRS